jgi:hypothetical protein
VLAAAEIAVHANGLAGAVDRDHRVIADGLARPAEIPDRLSGPKMPPVCQW